nr:hypothetical protein Iba_chr03cCG6130 [Ipomoea batatas]
MTDLRAAVVHTWERGRLDVVNNGDTEPFVQDEDSNLVAAFPWTLCTRLASERNGKVVNLAQLQKTSRVANSLEFAVSLVFRNINNCAVMMLIMVLAAFLAAGELRYIFRLEFLRALRQGVSCCTSHAADENCASAKSSISIATIMRLKDFILVAIDHCAVAALGRSTVFFGCMQRPTADSMPERFNVQHQTIPPLLSKVESTEALFL